MLVVWGGRTVCRTFIHQVSETEKGEKEKDQRTIHRRCKMAGSGRTKVASRVIGQRKGDKTVAKIFTSGESRGKERSRGKGVGVVAKE